VKIDWIRLRELIRKEFIQLFRDRKVRPILVIAPLIQILIFGYVVNYDIRHIRLAVLDEAQTRESRLIVDAFRGNGIFHITHMLNRNVEIEPLMLRGKADLVLKIAPDLSKRIQQGQSAAVQIVADGAMSNMAAVRVSYAMAVLQEINTKLIRERHPQVIHYGRIDTRIRTWYNPNLDSQYFFVPGIVAVIIMVLSLLLTSIAIIKEKEAGTMEQLIVTPLTPLEFIVGKTIPYILIALGQMAVVTVFAVWWFQIPLEGSIPCLFIAACLFLLSTLGIGLFISTVSATQQQAVMTTFFFLLPFFMLSGFVFPIANMPDFVQWLTYLNPMRYILVIIRGIFLKGVGMEVLWPQYLALLLLGTAVFAGAISLFHKRLD
jgi:ABC-2 type transport system permease protein